VTVADEEGVPWPFLGVLVSQPPLAKGDDDPQPPRVRGLCWVNGSRVVTAAHVAERADLLVGPGEGSGQSVRRVAGNDDLAVMSLIPPSLETPMGVAELFAGQPCTVAMVADYAPSVRFARGRAGGLAADGRFTVELEGTLPDDYTASGSPVVGEGGTVIGMVGATATSRSVDAFGAEPLRRVQAIAAAPTDSAPQALSTATRTALGHASAIIDAQGSRPIDPPTATLLGALRLTDDYERATVADGIVELVHDRHARGERLTTREIVDAVVAALGGLTPSYPTELPSDEALLASPLGSMLSLGESVRARVQVADRVHLRHLLAAVLTLPPPRFSERLFEELGASLPQLRAALRRAVADLVPEEPADVWDAILSEPAPFDLAGGVSSDLVDPTKGIPIEHDHLGVRDYVTMFATVIADRTTPMPLSIGLFGEWGSGKSYFMGLLREQVAALARSADERYHPEIVQIGFNAWHYADSNLWASLGDEIFEQLAGPGDSTDARRARLREDLAGRLQRRQELEAATERAREETARLTGALDEALVEREQSGRVLVRAVLSTPSIQGGLTRAWQRLGVTDATEQGQLLADELKRTPQDAALLRRAFSGRRRVLLLAALAVGAVAAIAGVLASRAWLADGGLVVLAGAVGAVGTLLARVRSGTRLLHEVAEGLRRETGAAVADELADLRRAEANERVLQAQLDEVMGQVGALGRELAELSPGQRLYRFVAERAASDAYRGQLGLISTIRKDFEELIALMEEWRTRTPENDADADARRPIDRIVLYIDDLDRCSSEQVVEVLQAVHLLLALDLFVVVVGVDPRWLLRSLRRQYRSMLTSGAEPAGQDAWWETTPQDYLEKIFNIPFALPRMSTGSFERLVRSLAETEADEHEEDGAGAAVEPRPEAEPDETTEVEQAGGATDATIPVEEESEVAALQAGTVAPTLRPLTRPELALLTALAPLVETPREAKRLMNLYRIIRSTRNLSPASRFLGSPEHPGEHQAVVILLGLLSGHAQLLEDVLVAPPGEGLPGGLRHRPSDERWADFVAGMAPRPCASGHENDVVGQIAEGSLAHWIRLTTGLTGVTELVTVADLEPFKLWAPRIARFSFLLSPLAGDDADGAPP
jgi:hypothetical protein